MDGKPLRSLRAPVAPLAGSENQVPTKALLHQRHKSAGNLKTIMNYGSLKLAPKRTPFGDVSNTANALIDIGPQDLLKTRVASHVNDKENAFQLSDALTRPAVRPRSMVEQDRGPAISIPPPNPTAKPEPLSRVTELPVPVVKNIIPKRATIVFNDAQEPRRALPVDVSLAVGDSAEITDNQQQRPRHHKSQPLLKVEQPSLRRTQSRLLPQTSELISLEDDVTANLYVDALEQQHGLVVLQEPANDHEDKAYLEKSLPGSQAQVEQEPAYMQGQPAKELPLLPASFPEVEEYWEEDEEDEVYDEQGYTTAHSYRSHGDNTTGGMTAMLAPKITAKVRKELDVARNIVEESRTEEELEEETWDVSMVTEYGEEIFEYMRELETQMTPNPHYMDIQTEIQWSMRSVLMDWLIQVHNRFSLLPETLFLTVNYIDRFLSVKIVSLGKLQLVGATAIFVAAKYEEINCPSIQEIVYMVDGGYQVEEILKAERFMLSMLGFELGWPGPMSFLRRISKADDYDLETRTLAKYFLEVTVMDERFVGSPPSFIAAGAHCLSRLMLKKGDWSPAHVHYSGYTFSQLKPLVSMIFDCCQKPEQHHAAVYDKYADRRYKRASQYVEEQIRKGYALSFAHQPSRVSAPLITLSDDTGPSVYSQRDVGLLIPIES